jgi:hypothetical protein
MIARFWKTGIEKDLMNEYNHFTREQVIPMFKKQKGIQGVQIINNNLSSAIITYWDSMDEIELMEKDLLYLNCVLKMKKACFLKEQRSVEIYELQDGFLKLNGYHFDIPKLQRPVSLINYSRVESKSS